MSSQDLDLAARFLLSISSSRPTFLKARLNAVFDRARQIWRRDILPIAQVESSGVINCTGLVRRDYH
jgi:hypothetical protein